MKLYISGDVDSNCGILQDMLSIADELGMNVNFESIGDNYNVLLIKEAIFETTGMNFEKYTEKRRCRNEYFARLIFAHECQSHECMSASDIAASLKRSKSNVQKYKGKYEVEFLFNKNFRRMAKKVNEFITKCVSQ